MTTYNHNSFSNAKPTSGYDHIKRCDSLSHIPYPANFSQPDIENTGGLRLLFSVAIYGLFVWSLWSTLKDGGSISPNTALFLAIYAISGTLSYISSKRARAEKPSATVLLALLPILFILL